MSIQTREIPRDRKNDKKYVVYKEKYHGTRKKREKQDKNKRVNLNTPHSDPGPNRDHKKRKKIQENHGNEAGIIFGSIKRNPGT